MNNPVSKIRMLKDSQRCLAFGLVSLLSLVGVPFALMAAASRGGASDFSGFCFFISVLSAAGFPFAVIALVISFEVRGYEKELWNPARPYRVIGMICAMIALIASSVVFLVVMFLSSNGSLFGV